MMMVMVVVLLGAACGSNGGAITPDAATTCSYHGMTYQVGDTWPAGDGCNTCHCSFGSFEPPLDASPPAQWGCTLIACVDGGAPDSGLTPDAAATGCVYHGMSYPVDATWPAGDGCNNCHCFSGPDSLHPEGNWGCSLVACVDAGAADAAR